MAASSKGAALYEAGDFLRCHSTDPADIQTQLWDVSFEPDPKGGTRSVVATCGGSAVCVIDIVAADVLMRYTSPNKSENFYSVAWSTITMGDTKTNILAAAGVGGEVKLIHPKNKVCYYDFSVSTRKRGASVDINALVFHSGKPNWLFCASMESVLLFGLGTPDLPNYAGASSIQLMKFAPGFDMVHNLAWTGDNCWLLAGTDRGLVGWHVNADKGFSDSPQLVHFTLPEGPECDRGKTATLVDSVAVANKWTIVTKYARHGFIYVWDLRSSTKLKNVKTTETSVIEKPFKLLARLRWANTQQCFMRIGLRKRSNVLCCGDDKGAIWIYDLPKYGDPSSSKDAVEEIEPKAILAWPPLEDEELEKAKKIPYSKQEIKIYSVAMSHDQKHMVAVTSNNLVCLWQKPETNAE